MPQLAWDFLKTPDATLETPSIGPRDNSCKRNEMLILTPKSYWSRKQVKALTSRQPSPSETRGAPNVEPLVLEIAQSSPSSNYNLAIPNCLQKCKGRAITPTLEVKYVSDLGGPRRAKETVHKYYKGTVQQRVPVG